MFGNLWWIFALLALIADLINPYIGIPGTAFGIIIMLIFCVMLTIQKVVNSKFKEKMKKNFYLIISVVLAAGIILRIVFFILFSGLLTETSRLSGIAFLFPQTVLMPVSLVFTGISITLHIIMCIAVFIKLKCE